MRTQIDQKHISKVAVKLAAHLYDVIVEEMEPVLKEYSPDLQEEVSMRVFNQIAGTINLMNEENDYKS